MEREARHRGCPPRQLIEQLARDEVSDDQREALYSHFRGCADCRHLFGRQPETPTVPLWPTVAGYDILGELGRGGMGVVYKAWQPQYERLVALKMILAGRYATPEQLRRFQAEARVAARLNHPNIVEVYQLGSQDGQPYLGLEFIDGPNLADLANGRPQPIGWSARLIETVAQAIHCAHQHGIIHRDLKPANVLLVNPGREPDEAEGNTEADAQDARPAPGEWVPKVTDFGLAKILEIGSVPFLGRTLGRTSDRPGPGKEQTAQGIILGTPSYMAPEQARGRHKEVGATTDVYALGAILYELLTGRPPFLGPTPFSTATQVINTPPVPPRHHRPEVPEGLEIICLKCLAKEPDLRYPTAIRLADALGRFADAEPAGAGSRRGGWPWWPRLSS